MLEQSFFPREVVSDVPRITMIGTEDVHVEQHHGLAVYQPQLILLRTRNGSVRITGHELRFRKYTSCEAEVTGDIMSISVEQPGRKDGAAG